MLRIGNKSFSDRAGDISVKMFFTYLSKRLRLPDILSESCTSLKANNRIQSWQYCFLQNYEYKGAVLWSGNKHFYFSV